MKIVITGVSGFIGSHLAELLLNDNYHIIGIDNFDPFYSRKQKQKNLQSVIKHENFEFYEIDVRSEDFTLALANNEIESIVHLAARAGVRPSLQFPQSYVHHDVEATVNLLEAARKFDISNLIFGSSSSVYGDNPNLPYKEEMKLDKPISPYAAAKLSCELFNHVFYTNYAINIINLRLFTVYGPRQRPDMAISKFVRLLDKNLPIQIFGEGETTRDYTYISDIVSGIKLAILNNTGYNTYNLGRGEPVRLNELINIIAKNMGKKPKIIQQKFQPGDVKHTLADISKAEKDLGYSPIIDIKEGIQRYIDWYYS